MYNRGIAHMGIGRASGENRAVEAAKQAIKSPLLETSIDGAKAVLLNITGGEDLGLFEVNEAADLIRQAVDEEAIIIFGAGIDENMKDEVSITVIATGFDDNPKSQDIVDIELDEVASTSQFNLDELDIPTFLRKKRR